MPKHFIADAPDGTLVHRSSETREYKFAIIARYNDGDGEWWGESWSSRRDLAEKAMNGMTSRTYRDFEARIVECREVQASELDWHRGGKAELKAVAQEAPSPELADGPNPTKAMYDTLYAAYDHFHTKLFPGELGPVVLLVHRKKNAHGYFWDEQWVTKKDADARIAEIALNPQTMGRDLTEVMSTLVHEMCHQWDAIHGKVPNHGHGRTWVAKMEEIGLLPVAIDAKNAPTEAAWQGDHGKFKQTGRAVTHLIMKGGPFEQECAELLARGDLDFSWFAAPKAAVMKKRDLSKVKHTCTECNTNIWGKLGLRVSCCGWQMMPADPDLAAEAADMLAGD